MKPTAFTQKVCNSDKDNTDDEDNDTMKDSP